MPSGPGCTRSHLRRWETGTTLPGVPDPFREHLGNEWERVERLSPFLHFLDPVKRAALTARSFFSTNEAIPSPSSFFSLGGRKTGLLGSEVGPKSVEDRPPSSLGVEIGPELPGSSVDQP